MIGEGESEGERPRERERKETSGKMHSKMQLYVFAIGRVCTVFTQSLCQAKKKKKGECLHLHAQHQIRY